MSAPIRTCVGCGRKAAHSELLRFVASDGALRHDSTGRASGRGAYTCSRRACFERATARRAFSRVLKQTVRVPNGLNTFPERI